MIKELSQLDQEIIDNGGQPKRSNFVDSDRESLPF